MVLNVHKNHKANYQLEERGGGGRGRLYTYRYTVTTRMTPALRWAAVRATLMFHQLWGTKSQDSAHKPQPFWREGRAKAELSQGSSVYQPTALLLGQTGSLIEKEYTEVDSGIK